MISTQFEHDLKESIRTIPDYPKPGILFRDITTLLRDPTGLRLAVDGIAGPHRAGGIDARHPVYVAELSLNAPRQGVHREAQFSELPRFPGMTRGAIMRWNDLERTDA